MAGGSSLTNPSPAQVPPSVSTNPPVSSDTQQSSTTTSSSQPTLSSTSNLSVGPTVVMTTVVIGGETIEYIPAGIVVGKDSEAFHKKTERAAFYLTREWMCSTRH
jgi:hypothetical protein